MIDTAHFLFHKDLKKKKSVLNQTTPNDAPVYDIIMYYLHRIVVICGHDDFSIIYVCVDMCARRQCFAKDFVSGGGGGGKLRVLNVT